MNIEAAMQYLENLWRQACGIWLSGGWAMIAIAFTAFVIFALGMHINLRLNKKGFRSVSEKKWRRWIEHPEQRKGAVGRLIDFVTGGGSVEDTTALFDEMRSTEIAPFKRDLRVMKICVGTAPLLGLLGTVTGMLATFGALASGAGGEKTMGMVAEGISEALITTETGLVIALPGLFFQYMLARKFERYQVFLSHIETVCVQSLHKKRSKAARAIEKPAETPAPERRELELEPVLA